MIALRPAAVRDLHAVLALLQDAGLPCQDLTAPHLADFLVASNGSRGAGEASLVGAVGLEYYGDNALLRSLVVGPESRYAGLGTRLADAAEAHAQRMGAGTLYLLTTTAAEFFARRGYEVIRRHEAPAALQHTAEFSSLCPAQAVCMRRHLIQHM